MSAVREWARLAGPALVLAVARERVERGQTGGAPLAVQLDAEQRHQVGQLLGIGWEVSGKSPTLKQLRAALEPYGMHLESLLEELGGPLVDRRALRAAAQASRESEQAAAMAALTEALPADLVDEAVRVCLSTRNPLALAEQLVVVARRLPAEVYLPVLAAECFGDSHALDRNRGLGRASARMAGLLGGTPVLDSGFSGQQWRDAWAGVGVSCDRVSTTVLTLNLPLTGPPAVRAMTGVVGEPVWLTARLLDRAELPDPLPQCVFVCENPSIVESAADRLGADCQPLVCTFGLPSQAGWTLVRRLGAAGVRLRVRADNDQAGRSIVAALRSVAPGCELWRYGPDAPTYEEQLMDELLADLARR